MRLTISGEEALYKKFTSLTKVMKTTFWGYVRTDLEENLLDNVKDNYTSGKLERNVYAKKIDDGVEGGVRNEGMLVEWNGKKINYAAFLNYGTKPHTIEPKDKKALRFGMGGANVFVGGRYVFAKSVKHPGTTATNFIENSAQETFKNLDKMFNKAMKAEGL